MVNSVSFYGSETAGSIGKRNLNNTNANRIATPQTDSVNFKGYDNKEKDSSLGSKVIKFAATTAIIVGGLGYAHKTNLVGKLKDGKFKDFLKKSDKITEPCHNLCHKVKGYGIKALDTVKGWFGKKG